MTDLVGVGYDGDVMGGRFKVSFDGREQAWGGAGLMSWLLPGSSVPAGRMWLLRKVASCLDEVHGKGRVYDAGQVSPLVDPRGSVLPRTVFVPWDQLQFFEMDNCWHCATEDDPCEVHVPEGAEVCEHFVGEGE